MSVPVTTIYIQSFTWNGLTFNAGGGGPIMGEFSHAGEPLEDRSSDQEYCGFLAVVNKKGIMRVRVREVKQVMALGTKSNGVMTLTGKANTVVITGANMVLLGVEPGEQSRAQAGSATLVFQYESADGTTVPFS